MDRRYQICDTLLLLLLTASVFGWPSAKASGVGSGLIVRGWKGDDIRLRCDIDEEPLAVYWLKESKSQLKTTKARFFNGNYESREKRFDIDKNFSLVITDLEVADEGLYYCQVGLKKFEILGNSTLVTVSSMASQHKIEECVDKGQSQQSRCTYQTPVDTPLFALTCVVSGFKPNISMQWIDESGKRLNPVVAQQTTLPDYTYERLETTTVSAKHGTEQTFTCIAIGDSLNGTSTEEITVLPIPGKRDNFAIIGLVIGIPVALAIIFLLVGKLLQKYYPEYLPRRGCGWNPFLRRPHKLEPCDVQEELLMASSPSASLLTEEQAMQCRKELKECYQLSNSIDSLNFIKSVNLDEIFTDLSLIDRGWLNKTPITYEELLTQSDNGSLSKRLLIQGEIGVGKTMLCSKIAWDWCQGRILQDLDMVLLIPLRDVTDGKSIGGIVKRYLADSNTATPKQIDNYISANLSKVLLVFDGFDEFNGNLSEKNSSEILRILRLEQYKACKVIVTTRPWRTDEFRTDRNLAGAYTFINIEGFNNENLTTYATRYFRIREKGDLAKNFISFVEDNVIIRSNMDPFPICSMLCSMWTELSVDRRKEVENSRTFCNIFRELISFLKAQYVSKLCKNVHNQKSVEHLRGAADTAIQDLSEIALNGLLDRKFSFSEENFNKCRNAMETCCKLGILTIERGVISKESDGNILSSADVKSTVSFTHRLFQEYIVGQHIAHLFTNDRSRYDNLKSELLARVEEFRCLFYFTSDLKDEIGLDIIKSLMKCIDCDFCVDVAFECHSLKAARAVGERWQQYTLSRDTLKHTKSGVVFMVQSNQVRSLVINRVHFGRTMSRALAKSMCSSRWLRKVSIDNAAFHSDFYEILVAKDIDCQIQDLELLFDTLDEESPDKFPEEEHMARWICSMPELSSFTVECPYLTDDVFSTAASMAESCQIKYLKMRLKCFYGDSQNQSLVGGHFARWVCTMPRLSSFSVECPYLPETFFSTATAMAKSCQIRKFLINLNEGWILTPSAENLAEFLCGMPHLESADIRCSYLPDPSYTVIASRATRCKLKGITINGKPLNESVNTGTLGDD